LIIRESSFASPSTSLLEVSRADDSIMRAECIRTIEELALSDPKVVVVASDPAHDFMPELAAKHPERLLIEGVCEQAIVGMSAGLASEGYYPFILTLAVFATRRCYEQILLDFGLHELSGCVVGYGGGFSYAPLGPTHIAVDDIALFSAIPRAAIFAPGEPAEAIILARHAREFPGLSYIRMAATTDRFAGTWEEVQPGKGRSSQPRGPVLFISCGAATLAVESALQILRNAGIEAGALHVHTVKPLDADSVRRSASSAEVVVCVEEHRQIGGLASAVLKTLAETVPPISPRRFVSIGVDDSFPSGYGDYEHLMEHYGLSGKSLAQRATALLSDART
jgi:transketolase